MTDEQIHVAIAKACGWSEIQKSEYAPFGKPYLVGRSPNKSVENLLNIPDFCNDLNAMHEAEEILSANQRIDFACYLTEPVRDQIYDVMPNDLHYPVCFPAIHATAAQRAEAFLRALNLWAE